MLNLLHLRVLAAVARHGSVTEAAKELHYSQPSVSHHLSRLEAASVATLPGLALRAHRLPDVHTTEIPDFPRQIYTVTYGDPPDPPATKALIQAIQDSARLEVGPASGGDGRAGEPPGPPPDSTD